MTFATGGPDAMFRMMQGHGKLSQRADGKQAFAFAIQAPAHEGLGNPEQLRLEALAGWLGKNQHCPRGYVIDKRTEITQSVHAIMYEGHCKA